MITDISRHITQMMGMAKDLELQGVELPEDVQAMVLMESLPESWKDVVTPIRVSLYLDKDEEALRFNNVCQRLQSAGALKQQFKRDHDDVETSSMVSSRGGFKGKCYNCGQSGHRKSDCPN